MSVWKSPVFYFGLLLSLLVVAALAAPYVVPWNNYRGQLERYGEKLTGRSVAIGGDIAVKLFPWPQLQANEVEIGNPSGFAETAFVKADVVRLRVSLGGLFNGSLDVESVDIDNPLVDLQRNATGEVNWIFAPTENVVGQGLLSRVKLDKITVRNGTVTFDDLRNGHGTRFTRLNALLSAQSVLGPWRMKGEASWNDIATGVAITTNAKSQEEPLTFTVKLSPLDPAFPVASVEGAWNGEVFKGAMRVDPQETNGTKKSAEGTLKPLAVQALVEASAAQLSLLKLRIAPADRKDNGTLIEGDAIVTFGSESQARIALKSPRINLDTLMGAEAMQQWRDGGLLSVANGVLANIPARLVADYTLNVSVLTSGGQTLNDVRLAGTVQREAIRIRDFAADMPGRSTAQFDGIVFPGADGAQLGGKLRFGTGDLRSFMSWLAPDWKAAFTQHWTGSRGRLDVKAATVDWTTQHVSLKGVAYEFEGAVGQAELTRRFGDNPSLDVTLNAGAVDVDSLLPNGWSFLRDGGLPELAQRAVQKQEGVAVERRLTLRASSLQLNGVAAQDLALTMESNARGLNVSLVDIGNVGGARLKGGGALIDQGSGPEGSLKFNVQAQDVRGLLRLAGLSREGSTWTDALGPTVFDVEIKAVPQKSGPELEFVGRGSSGSLSLNVVATARELEKLGGATLAASGGISSRDSAVLTQLLEFSATGETGPADMTFDFKGSMADGFVLSARVQALNAKADISGTARPAEPYLGFSGKVSMVASDGDAVVRALGLPVAVLGVQPLNLSAVLAARDGGLSMLDLAATLAGRRWSGSATVTADGQIQADLETDLLEAKEVFAFAFMPWTGAITDLSQSFATPGEGRLKGAEIFVRPLQFDGGTGKALSEVVVGFGVSKEARMLTISAAGEQAIAADVSLKARGAAYVVEGRMRWPIALGESGKTADGFQVLSGDIIIDGTFSATGRSPSAALAGLQGKGNYWLKDASLPRITLDGLATAILNAKTPEQLSAALARLNAQPGTGVGQRIGNFKVETGAAEFSAIETKVDGVTATLNPSVDFLAQQMKLSTAITLDARADLPPMTVTYAGPPFALAVRQGTSSLAAKLGYELLSREMAELERLQREQQALIAKEEAQRREDEKRFADYQQTKAELRNHARLRRFHSTQRALQAETLQKISDDALKLPAGLAKAELARHARRTEIRRVAQP